jgi:hypothetical protein
LGPTAGNVTHGGVIRFRGRLRAPSFREAFTSPVGVSLFFTLVISAVYYVYRYPLRLNDASTSPTYSGTPVALQVGKYALLAPFALAACAYVARRMSSLSSREYLLLALATFAVVRCGLSALDERTLVGFDIVAPLIAVVPVALAAGIALARSSLAEALGRAGFAFAAALLVAHAGASAVQISAWALAGRLPALAYADTALVRFGGIWDDPNSTGTYSAAFLVFLATGRLGMPGRVTALLAAVALFNVAVAQSFSAGVVLVIGLAIVLAVRLAKRSSARRSQWEVLPLIGAAVVAAALLVGAAAVLPYIARAPGLHELLDQKEESLRLRLHSETYVTTPESSLAVVIGAQDPQRVENALGNWFDATGIVGVGLLCAWLVLTIAKVRRTADFAWVGAVTVAVVIGSLFVPYMTIFPTAGLFLLAIGLTAAHHDRPIRSNEPPHGRRSEDGVPKAARLTASSRLL